MPLNERKVIQIIINQSKNIEQRCEGYREEILDVLSDIISYERQHRIQGTNIKQRIADKCNAAGRFLAENRSDTKLKRS